MNTSEPVRHTTRRLVIMLGIVLTIPSVVLLSQSAQSLADSPVSNRLAVNAPQSQAHGFIGLPDGNTLSVQNLLPTAANLTVTFALTESTPVSTVVDTLAGESFGVYPAPANFTGQARVEATGDTSTGSLPIFGVNFDLSDSGNSSYLGMNLQNLSFAQQNTSPSILPPTYRSYLPLVMKAYQGWTTVFALQNFNAFATANVELSFYNQAGVLVGSKFITIPVNGSQSFDLANLVLDSGSISDGYIGSVAINSDQAVTPNTARQYNTSHGLKSDYSGVGLTAQEASTTLIAPALFKTSNLQTSQLCIQNTGVVFDNVNVSYTDGTHQLAMIAPGAVSCLDQGFGSLHAAGWAGGAVITDTGTQPLLAVVNVIAYNGATPVGSWGYTVPSQFRVASGAFALPVLLDNYKSFTTTVYLYNFGDAPALVTPRYASQGDPADFVYCAPPISVPAHSVTSADQSSLPAFMNVSSGYFTSTQPLAVAVGATSSKPLGDTDRHFGYDAAYLDTPLVPQTRCSTIHTVYLPLVQR